MPAVGCLLIYAMPGKLPILKFFLVNRPCSSLFLPRLTPEPASWYKKPLSWADFWNVKDFPGKRALPDYASYALPLALLADGVKPENLYPLDVDRAFASLQKIKGSIAEVVSLSHKVAPSKATAAIPAPAALNVADTRN